MSKFYLSTAVSFHHWFYTTGGEITSSSVIFYADRGDFEAEVCHLKQIVNEGKSSTNLWHVHMCPYSFPVYIKHPNF